MSTDATNGLQKSIRLRLWLSRLPISNSADVNFNTGNQRTVKFVPAVCSSCLYQSRREDHLFEILDSRAVTYRPKIAMPLKDILETKPLPPLLPFFDSISKSVRVPHPD